MQVNFDGVISLQKMRCIKNQVIHVKNKKRSIPGLGMIISIKVVLNTVIMTTSNMTIRKLSVLFGNMVRFRILIGDVMFAKFVQYCCNIAAPNKEG